jgi:glycosyltransferase involved in cell wall biosynthesis
VLKVLLCPDRSGPHLILLKKYLTAMGIKVRMVPWFGKQFAWSMTKLFAYRLAGYRVLNLNWLPFNNLLEMRLVRGTCRLLGIEMVWTVHNLSPHSVQFGSREADDTAMRYVMDWSRELVVHSERTKVEFQGLFGSSRPVNVVPLANYLELIRTADPQSSRRKLGFPEDKVMVLMLGPSRWNKGVRSFLSVVSKLPDDYIGVLAGGCRNNEIRDLITTYQRSQPQKFVVRLEHLTEEEVAEYYAASDIFFMPFEDITTSGTIMEAISQGKAVVSTDKGNMRMLVVDGENGYVVSTEEEMSTRIRSIDRETARRMGVRSLEIARSTDWSDTASKYREIFERVLSS